MMHMSFWFGYDNIQMIFDKWIINDIPNLIGSCSGLFMMGIIYEFIKTWREDDFNDDTYFLRNIDFKTHCIQEYL